MGVLWGGLGRDVKDEVVVQPMSNQVFGGRIQ